MYHTLTLLPTGLVLLIGGRGSPQRPNSCVYLLETLTTGEWKWELMDLTIRGNHLYERNLKTFLYTYLYENNFYVEICYICVYVCNLYTHVTSFFHAKHIEH